MPREDRTRRLFVVRLDRHGRSDHRFGRRGTVSLPFMRAPRGLDVNVNRSHRGGAVAAGAGTVATVWLTGDDVRMLRSLVFRLRRSGALDRSFGRGGIARVGRLG